MTTARFLPLLFALAAAAGVAAQDDPVAVARAAYDRASNPAERVAALDRIADLKAGHDMAMVLAALSAGLEDDSHIVRVHAIGLVAAVADRDAALDALVAGCAQLGKRWQRLQKERPEPKGGKAKMPDPLEDPEGFREAMDEIKENVDRVVAWAERLEVEGDVMRGYVAALAGFDGDRVIAGYEPLLEMSGTDGVGKEIARRLFECGRRQGLEVAIAPLERHEQHIKELQVRVKETARTRPKPVPKYWKGSKSAWADREEQRIASLVDTARGLVTKAEDEARSYGDHLRELAGKRDLPAPPKDERYSSWRSWVGRAAKALPN